MKILRLIGTWILSFAGGIAAVMLGAGVGEGIGRWLDVTVDTALVEGLGGMFGLVVFLSLLVMWLAKRRLKKLLHRLDLEQQQVAATDDPFVQQAEILLIDLRRHHEIVQAHANVSLYAALTAASVALVALILSLYLFGFFGRVGETNSDFLSQFSAITGAISSLISATFGLVYNSSTRKFQESGATLEQRNQEILALRDARDLGRKGEHLRLDWAKRVLGDQAALVVEEKVQDPPAAATKTRRTRTRKPTTKRKLEGGQTRGAKKKPTSRQSKKT